MSPIDNEAKKVEAGAQILMSSEFDSTHRSNANLDLKSFTSPK